MKLPWVIKGNNFTAVIDATAEIIYYFAELIDGTAIGLCPRSPLDAIHPPHIVGSFAMRIGQPGLVLVRIGIPRGGSERAKICRVIIATNRSEEHTSELQSRPHLVCRRLLEK